MVLVHGNTYPVPKLCGTCHDTASVQQKKKEHEPRCIIVCFIQILDAVDSHILILLCYAHGLANLDEDQYLFWWGWGELCVLTQGIQKRLNYFVKLSRDRAEWGLSLFETFLKDTGKWSQYQHYQLQKKFSGGEVPDSYKKASKRKAGAQTTPSLVVTLKYRKTSDQSGARAPLGERDANAQILSSASNPPPFKPQPPSSSAATRNNPHH